ncbi:MAG: RnfABCDGE type electron transport complex subunit G [Candidatus Omnitrophota bacterium]
MNNIIKFATILFLVNLAAATVLAGVYNATKARIDQQQRLIQEGALREVMPGQMADRLEEVKKEGDIECWKAFKGNDYQPVGYVFIAKKYGYSSDIEIMVGVRSDGTITGVKVLSQNETPGLGAKISTQPSFTEQFKGRDVRAIEISKSGIQGITAATISSRAVVEAIRSRGMEILDGFRE